MAASKLNYVIVYKNHSQVYGCSSIKVAQESPPPEGLTEDDKNVFFITFEPDSDNVSFYKVDKNKEENE